MSSTTMSRAVRVQAMAKKAVAPKKAAKAAAPVKGAKGGKGELFLEACVRAERAPPPAC
jgi:hypothetical protein